jgi:hypothetical protein
MVFHINIFSYLFYSYAFAVWTVQPDGTPLMPLTSHVAVTFLTNVPVDETPESQYYVYEFPGVVVNIALI